MLTGFMNFIASIGKDFKTDYLIFALDSKGDSFRNKIYTQYKAHRPEAPEDLKLQLPIAIEFIESMGFATASKVEYEADDIIASLANEAIKQNLNVQIVSHDKDLYQLISTNIKLFDPIKKKFIDENECIKKYGIKPQYFVEYQSLLGDSADNIPGVKGVGAKTAQALIDKFNTLENIYQNLDNIEKPRWKKLLIEGKESAYISKQLVVLKNNIYSFNDLGGLSSLELPKENPILKISSLLQQYGLNRIIEKVHKDGLNYKTTIPKDYSYTKIEKTIKNYNCEYILLNTAEKLFAILNNIPNNSLIAFDTETTSLETKTASIVGFSFCFEENKAYYIPIAHFYLGIGEQISKDDAFKAIQILNKHKLILHNFKYDYEIIKRNFNIELNLFSDTIILAWLYNSNKSLSMDKLAFEYLNNYKTISFKDVVKKGEDFSSVNLEEACKYAAQDAFITLQLYFKFTTLFKKENKEYLIQLANSIEFPFIKVLNYMENLGIKIDIEYLKNLQHKSKQELEILTSQIYSLATTEFNINSPKQLGVVLFETLGLQGGKKTKTGYSTNETTLLKLKGKHPIIDKLLEYREAFKLYSTYIEPLLELAKKDKENRIYTSYNQTGTATGRLSSKNPNLQNIPVRTQNGKAIRKAFIAKDGYKLVSIDYSQIELRLLAHFSCDSALIEAFNNHLDIHLQTAMKIFGKEEGKEKRDIAKSINFGLIYGMGSRKLGEQLGIPSKEAKIYIDNYFKNFPTVKGYLTSIKEKAIENGYVKTLTGRTRQFDFTSVSGMVKASYEREAVNTVFQGSAADLIKLAMNKIYIKYKNNDKINMLLQIHDELIFEIEESIVQESVEKLAYIMKTIYKLNVPLDVSISIGDNWAILK